MSQNDVMNFAKEALGVAVLIAGPMLGGGLIVGLVVGLFQAMTQIQEQTLTFVPKVLVVVLVMLIMGPWMLNTLMAFAVNLINDVVIYARK
ncbi:MAG: flagellar biosynthesis protein FliQ [Peptococcaceae bacterium]|nr:flagellar biosynthesis protein FliQ [Peptococcaceae bacterium]